jgi:hypothetical protein
MGMRKFARGRMQLLLSQYRPISRSHALKHHVVVSLTSYPLRFPTLSSTLRCLLAQSIRSDATVLWIASNDITLLPKPVLDLRRDGLIIEECNDLRSYKKIVPALSKYPDSVIITADDDMLYPSVWMEQFVLAYRNPKEILCQRARRALISKDGFSPYHTWEMIQNLEEGEHVFPTGAGGVLYPPGSLDASTTNEELFFRICPSGDDVWLYWMAKRAGSRHRFIGSQRKILICPGTQWPAPHCDTRD